MIKAQLRPAPHRSATIAQQRSAVQCRALRCPAMLCGALQLSSAERSAVRYRALPCCVPCCTFTSSCMPVTYEVSYHVPALLFQRQVCTYYVVGSQTMHPAQVSPAIYSSAAQRSAVRCRALPFVLRCCVVRRFAFF